MPTDLERRLELTVTPPSRPLDVDAVVASGLRARRRRRVLRSAVAGAGAVVAAIVAVTTVTSAPGFPPIDLPPVSGDDTRNVTDNHGETGAEDLSPQSGDLSAEVDFEVYGIVPPDGWQLVDVGTRPDSYASRLGFTWLEARWTPTGTAGAGERDARLDLRQADASTVGDPPSEGAAEHVQLNGDVAAELIWTETGFGDQVGTVRWQLGSTHLELTSLGLDRDELLEVAKSAEPVPADRRH